MNTPNNTSIPAADVAAKPAEVKVETKTEAAPSHDPIKAELDRVKTKQPRSPAEKAAYKLKIVASELKNLGGDPAQVLEFKSTPVSEDDDNAPVTVAMLKERDREMAAKNAELLADEQIQDANERELVKYHLSNTIKSSGSPTEDLKIARALVNSVKNTQLAEESARRNAPKSFSTGAGSPPKDEGAIFEPTSEEVLYMRAPFNMTQADILKAREKIQKAQK